MGEANLLNALQLFIFIFVEQQPWFTPFSSPTNDETNYDSYQGTAVFLLSSFQYLVLGLLYSKGTGSFVCDRL